MLPFSNFVDPQSHGLSLATSHQLTANHSQENSTWLSPFWWLIASFPYFVQVFFFFFFNLKGHCKSWSTAEHMMKGEGCSFILHLPMLLKKKKRMKNVCRISWSHVSSWLFNRKIYFIIISLRVIMSIFIERYPLSGSQLRFGKRKK